MYKFIAWDILLSENRVYECYVVGNINIFMLMSHAPQVDTDKIRDNVMV